MKRITIVSVLALVSALCVGCVAPSGGTGTSESDQTAGDTYLSAVEGEEGVNGARQPADALDLDLHPNDDSQGPHPEPWMHRIGPHPEPWQGKLQGGDPSGSDDPSDPGEPSSGEP